MTQDTRIALFLMGELVASLCTNDPDLFKRWLYGGIEDLGEPAVTELLLDWLNSFLTAEEQDRLMGWHLGVSLLTSGEKIGWNLGGAIKEVMTFHSSVAILCLQDQYSTHLNHHESAEAFVCFYKFSHLSIHSLLPSICFFQ